MEQEFTVLENKAIGRNISMYRKVRGLKAFDIADKLDIKEQTYLKYERGETQITIDFIQKVSDVLKVDPLQIIATTPSNFIDNINDSAVSFHGNSTYNNTNEEQITLISKLIETQIAMNEKIMKLLERK